MTAIRTSFLNTCALLPLFLIIGMGISLHGQTLTQTTTVVKQSHENPRIAIAEFSGSAAQREALEKTLVRCGWFRVLPSRQANLAEITLRIAIQENGFTGTVHHGDTTHEIRAVASSESLARLELTDAILRKLFGVPAFCTRKIAFVRPFGDGRKELYACYLDGSGQERLTFNNAISTEPNWGTTDQCVYTLAKNNGLSIVLLDCKQKRQKVISHARGLNSSAALSPDGTKIALTLSVNNIVDLYVVELATRKLTRLTKDNSVESSPCWSPDGRSIVFVSDATGIGSPRLYRVPSNGTEAPARISTPSEAVSPDWSRRSNTLCFALRTNYGKYAIAILDMNRPDAAPEILTAADGDWEAPSWAPDGRHIICTRSLNGNRDLYLVDSLRGAFRPITKGAHVSLPVWQP